MRSALPSMVLGLLLLLATPTASAHAVGSPPITQSGVIELAPVTNQTGSAYHANITNLGIPPGPGDTLRFSWSANAGDGPAIHFEIHSHSGPYNYTEYYSIPLALRDDDSWTVPTADTYMVLWSNPSTKFVNVTYNFTLLAPPPDLTVFVVFPIILGVIVLLLWVARKWPHRPGPKESRLEKKDASGPAPSSDGTRTDQPNERPRRT